MKTKKWIFKVYLSWQDERESAWLRHMANKGWHFSSYTFCVYTFVKGKPEDIVYQLDFNNDIQAEHDAYVELFKADGWELAETFGSWNYFRKPFSAGGNMHIYTDQDSQIKKYQKILVFLIMIGAYSVVIAVDWWVSAIVGRPAFMQHSGFPAIQILMTCVAVLVIVSLFKLFMRIRSLRNANDIAEK